MNNWLLYDEGANKVIKLYHTFTQRKIQKYNEINDSDLSQYLPWICTEEIAQLIEPSQIKSLLKEDVVYENIPNLKVVDSLIKKSKLAVLYVKGETTDDVSIDHLALEQFPEYIDLQKNAILILQDIVPWIGKIMSSIITAILPITTDRISNIYLGSMSSHLTTGAIYLSYRGSKSNNPLIDGVISLAHETAHNVLVVYQNADPILISGHQDPVYSSVRQTNRPAIMAIHAAVAMAYMIVTIRSLIQSYKNISEAEIFYLEKRLQENTYHFEKSIIEIEKLDLTLVGKKIVSELKEVICF